MSKKSEAKKARKEELEQGKDLIERPVEAYFLRKNVEAMKLLGWDKTDIIDRIKQANNTIVKIDPDIVLGGVKNPLTTVFVGFSTRHLFDAMARKKKVVKYTVIIEPDLATFKHLISTEDISDLLLRKDVEFIIGIEGEAMLPHLFRCHTKAIEGQPVSRSTLLESMQIIVDPFQPSLEGEAGETYVKLVKDTTNQLKLSMGCSDDQFRRFELLMLNKKNMYNSWKINGLFNKFQDVPTIVLGGGPSLDTFIEEYKRNSALSNALIISADAVLPKILAAGIKPHIVVRCERKLTNIFKGVTKEQTKGIYYAAYPWTPPEYFDLFDDSMYLFRQNGVCLFTELSHGFIDGGVSSSNACLEMAIDLGAKNIILSGVDLCFIDGKSHTEGTQVEFNIQKSKEKWFELPSNDGKTVTSIPVWGRCRNEYSQSIDKWTQKGKQFKVYNTSLQGAVITNTVVKPWSDLADLFTVKNDVPALIQKNLSKLSKEEIDKFEAKIIDTLAKLKEYLNVCTIAIGLAEDSKRTAERELHKLVNHVLTTVEKPYDQIRAFRQNAANYEKLWSGVSDAYDQNFKAKLYTEQVFRILIFDVLQLDLYMAENTINSMLNNVDFIDERHFGYYTITKELAVKVKYYLEMFIELFEKSKA